MSGGRDRISPFFVLILCLLALGLRPAPTVSAEPIYKYVDDAGTVHYTDQGHSIPEKYRTRVQTVDPKILNPALSAPVASIPAIPAIPDGATTSPVLEADHDSQVSQQGPSPLASWLDRFSALTIPVPSRFQLSVGGTSVVLIIGAIMIMRVSRNPLAKFMLKAAIALIIVGTFYITYFSSLNERISQVTGAPAQRTITGEEVNTTFTQTVGRLKQTLEQTTEMTIGEAQRSVEKVNQANRELEERLHEIEAAQDATGRTP